MNAQIVFLTLFLGLTSGVQQVNLHVDGPVKAVRIMEDGHEIARMTAPPWNTSVDLGPLAPHELAAVGLDAAGNEIARASQVLNLPRPLAEFEIALGNDRKTVTLRWRHMQGVQPANATMNVDGRPVLLDKDFRAVLPKLDPLVPHVIAAEIRFKDGFVARRELVLQGLRSDSAGTELTPVVFDRRPGAPARRQYDECFSAFGNPLHVNAVEKPKARVVIVQDPYSGEAVRKFDPTHKLQQPPPAYVGRNAEQLRAYSDQATRNALLYTADLASDTSERIIWPIGRLYGPSDSIAMLFQRSREIPAGAGGMLWLLTRSFENRAHGELRRFADAVAVAGVEATVGGFRRAVVLVLSDAKDGSDHTPAAVRQYLADIGVPLFVWSLSGPRPDLAKTWGPVDDISNSHLLIAATRRLRDELDSQRVAWLAVDPLDALHVEVKADCGLQRIP